MPGEENKFSLNSSCGDREETLSIVTNLSEDFHQGFFGGCAYSTSEDLNLLERCKVRREIPSASCIDTSNIFFDMLSAVAIDIEGSVLIVLKAVADSHAVCLRQVHLCVRNCRK